MMRRQASESTKLTDREHEVLLLLADGLGAAARSCSQMGLAVGTDENVLVADTGNHVQRH
jgi:DNA-binding CsgD family transcriptional regulator